MSIDQALTEIGDCYRYGTSFSIKFVGMDGEIRHYPRARYGATDSFMQNKKKLEINEKLGTAQRDGRKISLMRDDGTIPMTNLDTQEFKTIKWFSLIEYNGERVF